MEYTEAERRDAFDSWDRYIPRFKEGIAKMSRRPEIATERTLLDNPMVMLIYADGYLNGRQSGDKPEGVKQLRDRCRDLTAMIEELIWAMHLWGNDEDGIHHDAYAAFVAALKLVGIEGATYTNEDGDTKYRFDPDWIARQREQWGARNQV